MAGRVYVFYPPGMEGEARRIVEEARRLGFEAVAARSGGGSIAVALEGRIYFDVREALAALRLLAEPRLGEDSR